MILILFQVVFLKRLHPHSLFSASLPSWSLFHWIDHCCQRILSFWLKSVTCLILLGQAFLFWENEWFSSQRHYPSLIFHLDSPVLAPSTTYHFLLHAQLLNQLYLPLMNLFYCQTYFVPLFLSAQYLHYLLLTHLGHLKDVQYACYQHSQNEPSELIYFPVCFHFYFHIM